MSTQGAAPAGRVRLGLVTIGQAPRVDLTPDVADVLARVDWVEHGALDLLDATAIAALAPGDGEHELVSRLRDATSARLGTRSIAPHLDAAIARCADDGCAAVLVLCTGRVEHGAAVVPVLHAEQLAHEAMAGLVGQGRLGVLCPLPAQTADIQQRWSERLGRPVVAVAVDPYTAQEPEFAAAGERLAGQVDAVFLDCMGYTQRHAALVAAAGTPTHTARALAVGAAVDSAVDSAVNLATGRTMFGRAAQAR